MVYSLLLSLPLLSCYIQVCGSFPDTMARCAELISNKCSVDFVDINVGCPIDLIFKKVLLK